jgi:hypothetical protein|tara:strand:+ start:999 stop:1196 length:198 start_codon:yes stop_codon:yes gene_type:complete
VQTKHAVCRAEQQSIRINVKKCVVLLELPEPEFGTLVPPPCILVGIVVTAALVALPPPELLDLVD